MKVGKKGKERGEEGGIEGCRRRRGEKREGGMEKKDGEERWRN